MSMSLGGVLDGILDLLITVNIRLVTTLNYNAIANFRILQFTRTHTKSFTASSVYTSSCSVAAPTVAIPLLPGSSSF
jgi:hypothetical protein